MIQRGWIHGRNFTCVQNSAGNLVASLQSRGETSRWNLLAEKSSGCSARLTVNIKVPARLYESKRVMRTAHFYRVARQQPVGFRASQALAWISLNYDTMHHRRALYRPDNKASRICLRCAWNQTAIIALALRTRARERAGRDNQPLARDASTTSTRRAAADCLDRD